MEAGIKTLADSDSNDWLTAFLASNGLQQYGDLLKSNHINETIILQLKESDLEKLGISSLGHRLSFMQAISVLREKKGEAGNSNGTNSSTSMTGANLPQPNSKQPESSNGEVPGVVTWGYICAAISLLIFPPGFGIAGVTLGVISLTKDKIGHGIAIIVLSVTLGFFGMIIGALVNM